MSEIRVLIVEDEPAIAKFISYALEEKRYIVSGIAFDPESALEELSFNKPDIVLLDINLESDQDGIDLAMIINKQYQLPFIFLTSYANTHTIERAKLTRPMGYILKPFTEDDLFATLEIALYNYSQRLLPPELSLDRLNDKLFSPLTEREFDVLKGIYDGKNNQELSELLFVSTNTIKTHIKNLYSKVSVGSRWELLIVLRELMR